MRSIPMQPIDVLPPLPPSIYVPSPLLNRRSVDTIYSTSSLNQSTGTVKPVPALEPYVVTMALSMPTSLSFPYNRVPTGFPLLMAVSVFMNTLIIPASAGVGGSHLIICPLPPPDQTSRLRSNTTPDIMVWSSRKGFPVATWRFPTNRCNEEPYGITLRVGER